MELCRIVARQPVRGKLADNEVAGMIKCSAQPADDTFRRISETMRSVRNKFDEDLASIGLEISNNMTQGEDLFFNCRDNTEIIFARKFAKFILIKKAL